MVIYISIVQTSYYNAVATMYNCNFVSIWISVAGILFKHDYARKYCHSSSLT